MLQKNHITNFETFGKVLKQTYFISFGSAIDAFFISHIDIATLLLFSFMVNFNILKFKMHPIVRFHGINSNM